MHFLLNPMMMASELIYSLIIIILCSLIFFRTKEMYDLTKHKGILLFRYSFLFFGLAYAFRVILFTMVLNTSTHLFWNGRTFWSLIRFITAYFSTMAILSLVYSTIKIKERVALISANILAILIAFLTFVFHLPVLLSLIQLLLLILSSIIILKQKSKIEILYLLIFSVWLINLVLLDMKRLFPFEVRIIFQIITIGIFATIYYKVLKWIK